jgi:hypothetical protein
MSDVLDHNRRDESFSTGCARHLVLISFSGLSRPWDPECPQSSPPESGLV